MEEIQIRRYRVGREGRREGGREGRTEVGGEEERYGEKGGGRAEERERGRGQRAGGRGKAREIIGENEGYRLDVSVSSDRVT